jgi:RNA polymerase sigma-70 factor, ECF subfamily
VPPTDPTPEPPTLAPWLAAARAGDTEALGRLLELCRAHLLGVADRELASRLRPKAGASDLVQEAFLDAHRLFDQFEGTDADQLLAWLRAILMNRLRTVVNRYRGTDKRALEREVPLADGSSAPSVADAQPSPSGVVLDAEQSAAVRAALERLPEHYRQILIWRHWDELTFEEIGQRLGKTPDAARMLWGRAVAQLEREVEPPP